MVTATLLATISRPVPVITTATTVNQAIELFQHDTALTALPVMDQQHLAGIINRRELFFRHLAKPFARELFGRKPIATLLEGPSLVLAGELEITDALNRLLLNDPQLENDCFGVSLADGSVAIATVADLMMAISRSQAALLETLESLSSRIRSEVEMARQVQAALLPVTPLRHAGVSVAAGLVNSTEISGDFYDVFPLDEHRLGLLVADVTGHGVQAGLVTTAAKAGLQTLLDNGVRTPALLLRGINRALMATAGGSLLMTALVAVLDRVTGTAVISSAGHPFPYRRQGDSGQWQLVALKPGFPLGFVDDADYDETTIGFMPNDHLLLYSDGIQEAEDEQGVLFGEQQLLATLQQAAGTPEQVRDTLLAAARSFRGNDHFDDDVTLVVAQQEE
ncbi:MAG: PP2C family protein-serine/threonine phosphatase [Geobacter sp.]